MSFLVRKKVDTRIASGITLVCAAFVALAIYNSPLSSLYDAFLSLPLAITLGDFELNKPLLLWINDGLMVIFFFLIGLEVKREIVQGELSSREKAALPIFAALGGIIVPALIYMAFNWNSPEGMYGWGIPVATDIAFALAVMALLGSRVPRSLKILLLSLAIIDDIAAILIIAIFYTSKISLVALGFGVLFLCIAGILNLAGVTRKAPYILIGIIAWFCVLESGVHATLAGVALAFTIPLRTGKPGFSPLKEMEVALYRWVAFLIMPLFAFANAGVYIDSEALKSMSSSVPIGILLGLFVGKQLGVFSFIYVFAKLGLCKLPEAVSWLHIYGLSLIAGIGFTMSLFIGSLAFEGEGLMPQVRIAVLIASFLSAIFGYIVLRMASKN